jgi:hypothetical protein
LVLEELKHDHPSDWVVGSSRAKKKTREKHLARTRNAWKTRNISPSPPVAHGGGGGVGPKKSDRKTLGPSLTTFNLA